jgi:hypothetical protein
MSLTAAQKQAYARAHSSTVHLYALELRHPSFVSPIRIVQHKDDITLTHEASAPEDPGASVLYTALGFQLKEPEVNSEPDSTISIQVDGVSGAVQPYLNVANLSYVPIEASIRPFSYDTVAQSVGEMMGVIHLQVRHIRINKTSVVLTLGYTNSANRTFPFVFYTADNSPGLL